MQHLLAVLGLSLACGLWVLVQRFVAARDPGQPGVEGARRCSHHEPGCAEKCTDPDCCVSQRK